MPIHILIITCCQVQAKTDPIHALSPHQVKCLDHAVWSRRLVNSKPLFTYISFTLLGTSVHSSSCMRCSPCQTCHHVPSMHVRDQTAHRCSLHFAAYQFSEALFHQSRFLMWQTPSSLLLTALQVLRVGTGHQEGSR